MKDLKDELIEKQKELIAWLKCISIDITVLRTREKLESEIASLESQIKEKPIRTAEELDLMQYVTNLLYSAYADGKAKVKSSTFDAFVEEQIELVIEYLNRPRGEQKEDVSDLGHFSDN